MTHLPLMFTKDPKELLIICFGMGTTVKSAAAYPELNVTAVELVSETFEAFNFYHPNSDAQKRPTCASWQMTAEIIFCCPQEIRRDYRGPCTHCLERSNRKSVYGGVSRIVQIQAHS